MRDSRLPTGDAAEKVRVETTTRTQPFLKELARLLPNAIIKSELPAPKCLAATVRVWLTDPGDDRRKIDCSGPIAPHIAFLTDNEKIHIGTAVGQAASSVGMEALFKPKWSDKSKLTYRVFYRG